MEPVPLCDVVIQSKILPSAPTKLDANYKSSFDAVLTRLLMSTDAMVKSDLICVRLTTAGSRAVEFEVTGSGN
ncbi:hypothetical protein TcWFU_005096 [Taenia crassiceps]|uniref:Uncharacterized protein n=1 Tax=Taenia crassiceps TaxID=6207 RepID=A0ABR4QLS2_9CEST